MGDAVNDPTQGEVDAEDDAGPKIVAHMIAAWRRVGLVQGIGTTVSILFDMFDAVRAENAELRRRVAALETVVKGDER